ncbi:MAG: ABC transporter ATP-binding protein [Bacillota bacterium]|nr:ABC transporter ATP-binding protein [Bacillota bacterium]
MNLLEIKGLCKNFGGLQAVSNFDLTLAEGELHGLIGPNGAGKTTVFNLITGIYRPTAGSIFFQGRELVGLRPHQITRLGIARTFQNIRLFGQMTVLDNIRLAFNYQLKYGLWDAIWRNSAYRQQEEEVLARSLELLRLFKLEGKAHFLAKNLPYGEQRRLEIARALATRPRLLLLDEPAAGMNPREVDELIDLIRWIRSQFQLTILLIEHQMRAVMNLCQKIDVMDFGQIIARGAPEEIRNHPQVIKAYLGEESA